VSFRITLKLEEYNNLRAEVFKRDKWKCRVCLSRDGLHGHHVKYRSQGGDDVRSNLLTLCSTCHDSVHRGDLVVTSWPENPNPVINTDNDLQYELRNGWTPGRKAT
jgi:predicted HNH restriction endonuclease